MSPSHSAAKIALPRSALRYALLQRPMLARLTGLPRRLGLPPTLLLRANVLLHGSRIAVDYSRMIHADFEMIRPYLPQRAEQILDIGCGIGGLDVMLYRHYQDLHNLRITLLDRTDPQTFPGYGFHPTMEYYNSLGVSSAVLRHNKVPSEVFQTLDTANDDTFPEGPLDLVVSLASWGFHYPLSTYLEQVTHALAPGGRLILDLRRGHGQEHELAAAFADSRCIGSTWNDKAGRHLAIKRA